MLTLEDYIAAIKVKIISPLHLNKTTRMAFERMAAVYFEQYINVAR